VTSSRVNVAQFISAAAEIARRRKRLSEQSAVCVAKANPCLYVCHGASEIGSARHAVVGADMAASASHAAR
jgi:hypothetical protein